MGDGEIHTKNRGITQKKFFCSFGLQNTQKFPDLAKIEKYNTEKTL